MLERKTDVEELFILYSRIKISVRTNNMKHDLFCSTSHLGTSRIILEVKTRDTEKYVNSAGLMLKSTSMNN